MRPTIFNRALPRMKPQPEAISMMILKRRKARQRRQDVTGRANRWWDDLDKEHYFEEALAEQAGVPFKHVFRHSMAEWSEASRCAFCCSELTDGAQERPSISTDCRSTEHTDATPHAIRASTRKPCWSRLRKPGATRLRTKQMSEPGSAAARS